MKKAIVISALVATSIFSINQAKAEASKEENIGFASGAAAGAAIGGPAGFIIGGAIGALFGNQVEKANQLDEVSAELASSELRERQLKRELTMIQEDLAVETAQASSAQWVTEGLTLNLMFTTNSAALSDADLASIERISTVMTQFPELSLRLDGYTDPRGTKKDNMTLSQKRVDSVIAAFEKQGVPSHRLIGIAHGEVLGFTNNESPDVFAMARKVSVNFVTRGSQQVAQN
ncbi:OmpA family protein [Aliikangiella marina]|uniref:OmpA family protein n=1 Tax=Aliikangiella marina TaxID=1712262 RepID=A0A545TI38_9GAMM|nr:OmpA family protein [Aliikangiella marina]TQV76868.1 OmpA family protein [Aliikangiella marina]